MSLQVFDQELNYREFHIQLYGKTIVVAGMMHPMLVSSRISTNVLETLYFDKGITHIVSLEADFNTDSIVKNWVKFDHARHYSLFVQDFGIPTLVDILQLLGYFKREIYEAPLIPKFAFHCRGGNGRTGLLLALMLTVSHVQNNDPLLLDTEKKISVKAGLWDSRQILCYELVAKCIKLVRDSNKRYMMIETVEQVEFLNVFFETLKLETKV